MGRRGSLLTVKVAKVFHTKNEQKKTNKKKRHLEKQQIHISASVFCVNLKMPKLCAAVETFVMLWWTLIGRHVQYSGITDRHVHLPHTAEES